MEFEFVVQIASAVSAPLVSVQFALLVCVSVTVWRTGLRQATGVLRCQFGASLFATISSTSILLQYSVPWTPDMNPLWCELNSRATPFFCTNSSGTANDIVSDTFCSQMHGSSRSCSNSCLND